MCAAGYPSTGFDQLDEILSRLQLGDNVVWQVDDVKDYKDFVAPYVEKSA